MHHVLASNAALDTFPKNHASAFSTPIVPSYTFDKPWEVALTNLTHSNCIYTFNKEMFHVTDTMMDSLTHIQTHVPITLTCPSKSLPIMDLYRDLAKQISDHPLLKYVLRIEHIVNTFFRWIVRTPDFYVIISDSLRKVFGLTSTVITQHDPWPVNVHRISSKEPFLIEDAFITIGRSSRYTHKITLKEGHSSMSLDDLCNTFNRKLRHFVTVKKGRDTITLTRMENDDSFIILSQPLINVFSMRHAGFRERLVTAPARVLSDSYIDPWDVYVYHVQPQVHLPNRYILTPQQFITPKEACAFLSTFDPHVVFTCDAQATTTMEIKKAGVKVFLDDTLRDILAFDKNHYEDKGKFIASGTLSLVRRIQYLYIYSNVSGYIRVGDTEAPLLAVIPFNASECQRYRERIFKQPMYSPVICDRITQIDIEIRDDAGQVIPFHSDALTTMRLHFRPRQLRSYQMA